MSFVFHFFKLMKFFMSLFYHDRSFKISFQRRISLNILKKVIGVLTPCRGPKNCWFDLFSCHFLILTDRLKFHFRDEHRKHIDRNQTGLLKGVSLFVFMSSQQVKRIAHAFRKDESVNLRTLVSQIENGQNTDPSAWLPASKHALI